MPKFRKKPVVIDAIQYREEEHYQALEKWGLRWDTVYEGNAVSVPYIITLEGLHHVSDKDWIIKG